jgi:acetyl esterase/lipase
MTKTDTIGKLSAEKLHPLYGPANKIILYLHGGAYVMSSAKQHRNLTLKLTKISNIPLLAINYRLAPEFGMIYLINPAYPLALHDAYSAYLDLLRQGFLAKHIIVAGDSAGGINTCLQKEGLP